MGPQPSPTRQVASTPGGRRPHARIAEWSFIGESPCTDLRRCTVHCTRFDRELRESAADLLGYIGVVTTPGERTPVPIVFILGAPRSGTTFVQQEIARRSGVGTTTELHYLAHYVAPALRRWSAHQEHVAKRQREFATNGTTSDKLVFLPAALEEAEFLSALRAPIEALIARGQASEVPLSLLVLKTPSDSLYVDDIISVFPEASFVHVVRSPFDVIRSYRAVSKTWAGRWAPRSTVVGVMMWRIHVLGSASAAGRAAMTTVRYEDVRVDPSAALDQALTAIGHTVSSEFDEAHMWLTSAAGRELMGDRDPIDPPDVGDGTKARPDLNPLQRRLITVFCRDLLATYGYLAPGERTELSAVARWTLRRVERWYNAKLRRGITNALAAPSATVTLLPQAAPTN